MTTTKQGGKEKWMSAVTEEERRYAGENENRGGMEWGGWFEMCRRVIVQLLKSIQINLS